MTSLRKEFALKKLKKFTALLEIVLNFRTLSSVFA